MCLSCDVLSLFLTQNAAFQRGIIENLKSSIVNRKVDPTGLEPGDFEFKSRQGTFLGYSLPLSSTLECSGRANARPLRWIVRRPQAA